MPRPSLGPRNHAAASQQPGRERGPAAPGARPGAQPPPGGGRDCAARPRGGQAAPWTEYSGTSRATKCHWTRAQTVLVVGTGGEGAHGQSQASAVRQTLRDRAMTGWVIAGATTPGYRPVISKIDLSPVVSLEALRRRRGLHLCGRGPGHTGPSPPRRSSWPRSIRFPSACTPSRRA